ncbi:hypothetical protein JCM33374_g2483 [Metschnikowia sp. JCM 33374]|nr:hypothetical protein JCM33374_g2483 [Metschnikowia sp. JCM 33374]
MRLVSAVIFVCHALWVHAISAPESVIAQQKLAQAASNTADFIIPVANSDFSLFSLAERDHFTLLLLTSTDDQHECTSCHTMKNVLRRVAAAWTADYYFSEYLYIAEVDLVDRTNAEVFNYLKLQTVPQLWLVPPSSVTSKHTSGRKRKTDEHGFEYFDNYDLFLEPHAEFKLEEAPFDDQVFQMADWLAMAVQKQITIRQENAYKKFIVTFVATFSLILLVKKRGPSIITNTVTKKKIYSVVFFGYLLLLLGGFSFSLMNQVPFIAQNDKNEPIYLSGGSSWQFGVEMVLVGGIYGLLGAALVLLVYLGNYEISDTSVLSSESQRGVLVLVATAALYFFYSVMTSMFLRKEEWYPYHFTKLF